MENRLASPLQPRCTAGLVQKPSPADAAARGLGRSLGTRGLRVAWWCHAGDVKGLQGATLRGFEGNGETSLSEEPG